MSRRSKKKPTPELSPASKSNGRGPWQTTIVCLVLLGMVWIVFGQTRSHEFVNFDDDVIVTENPIVQGGLTFPGIASAFTSYDSKFYSPVRLLSHMLDQQLYGKWAGGHHLTNVILHAASTILLFLALKKMTGAFWRSACVAALFAVHPLHVESVAWVSERKDTISGLFCMLTLFAYAHYATGPKSIWQNLLVAVSFALGLLSKPTLVALPFALLLLDYWPLKRFDPWKESNGKGRLFIPWPLIQEKLLLFALTIAASLVAVFAQADVLTVEKNYTLFARIENAIISYLIYFRQTIYPVGLAPFYPHPGNEMPIWKPLVALAVLIAISLWVFTLRRKYPYVLVGWLWYLGMLVPVSGIVHFGDFATADRFMYLPQTGLCIAIVWLVTKYFEAWPKLLAGLAVIVLGLSMFFAFRQTTYWANSISLWTHTISSTSGNYLAHGNYAIALSEKGDTDGAIRELNETLKIDPKQVKAYQNLGSIFLEKKDFPQAIRNFAKAVELQSESLEAYNNLAQAYSDSGQFQQALSVYRDALKIKPVTANTHMHIGNTLMKLNRADEAIEEYRNALKIEPEYKEAIGSMANALLERNRFDEAIVKYQKVIEMDPANAKTYANLGTAFLHKGDSAQAIANYEKAVQLDPQPAMICNYADALTELGKTNEAIRQIQRALQIKPGYADGYRRLAQIYVGQTNWSEALKAFEETIKSDPADFVSMIGLSWLLTTTNDPKINNPAKAVELAERANQLTRGAEPMILRPLAAAYFSAKRVPEAIETARKAVSLAESRGDSAIAQAIRADIQSYEAGKPPPNR